MPSMSYSGFFYAHAPKEIKEKQAKKRKQQTQRTLKSKLHSLVTKEGEGKVLLQRWYQDRRKEMTGICENCGEPSSKENPVYWKWSCCHLLPKEHFTSVKLNKYNFLELCISCHVLYDRNFETARKMKVFTVAKERFQLFKNEIADVEQKRINPYLLK